MSSSLVTVLHQEERSLVAELRASKPFQRLEAIRRLLALYDAQPSIATGLDMLATPERGSGEVIHFASTAAPAAPMPSAVAAQAAVTASAAPVAPSASPMATAPGPVMGAIPMPGPTAMSAAPASAQAVAFAEAAVADVVERSPVAAPAPVMASAPASMTRSEPEASSVVSSVRAALLGIGKN